MKSIKIILMCCMVFVVSCKKTDIPLPNPLENENVFSVSETTVSNGQSIHLDLPSTGVYILTLMDKPTNQVVSREKFNGQKGKNIKKIYTNSLQSRYLYLLLEDVNKTEIGKTTIIIK